MISRVIQGSVLLGALLAVFNLPAVSTLTYQGQLNQANSRYDGTVDLEFALFDAPNEGNLVATVVELNNHRISNGLFQADIDFGSDAFGPDPRYLEVRVNGLALEPRQPVRPAPLALHALSGAGGDGSNWSVAGDDIFYSKGRVGIGIDTPEVELQVVGKVTFGAADNLATGNRTFVGGGQDNQTSGSNTFVGGGQQNRAGGADSAIVGGDDNLTTHSGGFIGGGRYNWVRSRAFVGGGQNNHATGARSFIGAGDGNIASGNNSFIAGGEDNLADGRSSFVAAGDESSALGRNSLAAGHQAGALHDGTFVWADRTFEDFSSTANNQFLIRASGGVGFGRAPEDHFEIFAPVDQQDDDYGFGTGAFRVMLRDPGTGNPATRLRLLGNGGLAVGRSFNGTGVPANGLRVQGATRLGNSLVVEGNSTLLGDVQFAGQVDFAGTPVSAVFGAPVALLSLGNDGETPLCLNSENRISDCSAAVLAQSASTNVAQIESERLTKELARRDARIDALQQQLAALERLVEQQQDLIADRLAAVETRLGTDTGRNIAVVTNTVPNGEGL
jgi:hypothetical protein